MSLTEIQLDYVLEKMAADDPEHWSFNRAGTTKKVTAVEDALAWERVLTGKDREALMKTRMPSQAVLDKLRALQKHSVPVIRRNVNAQNKHNGERERGQ